MNDKPDNHFLTGKYVGVKASAALYSGSGVQVLVGGGANNITLQPIAFEGSRGVGATAGLSYLSISPKK